MNRRRFVVGLAAAGASLALSGHTPYRQWKLYRQTHLLIFTTRDDPGSDELGERIAACLRTALPDSKARVARAPHAARIASLMTSGQADAAVLSHVDAAALYARREPFGDYPPVELRVLVQTGQYQLVCRADFKPEHAYVVAEALVADPGVPALVVPVPDAEVPTHPGALAFLRGEPLAQP